MAAFRSIHTAYGLARIAQAEASGKPINLPVMAVGDGNGNPVSPIESQTGLVRERYRAPVNRVYQDPDDSRMFTVEFVIPASVGGFTMREIGIFDDQGSLFVVGNLPDTYKPTGAEGAYSDAVIRLQFLVRNGSVISLAIDPTVTMATQRWVINLLASGQMFPGGTTGQILTKRSNADGDATWQDPSATGVVVRSIEELQTLAANQTVVDLSKVTTTGLAVYIEGVRLRSADQWAATSTTRVTLPSSYPAGTKVTFVQNDPAGSFFDPLAKSQNLADVPDKAAARANLQVYSKSEVDTLVSRLPAGTVAYFAGTTAPAGWFKANGAAVSRTAYADLFAVLGTRYGAGDGFATFNLPDLRGEFIRGWDDGKGTDAGRPLGNLQESQNREHTHEGEAEAAGQHGHPYVSDSIVDFNQPGYQVSNIQRTGALKDQLTAPAGEHTHKLKIKPSGGSEARPRNVSQLAIIKF